MTAARKIAVPAVLVALVLLLPSTRSFAGSEECRAAFDANDWARVLSKCPSVAEQGDVFAEGALGFVYSYSAYQDHAKAARWYRMAAERGNPDAQYNLGYMYEHGEGVLQDFSEAARWYRLAAEQGDNDAQTNLGYMYDHGDGVPQDYAEALRWYRLAAEQGNYGAQNGLGLKYHNGEGILQDFVQAHKWYNIAAAQGSEIARENRDLITRQMTPEQIAEARRLAREWQPAE